MPTETLREMKTQIRQPDERMSLCLIHGAARVTLNFRLVLQVEVCNKHVRMYLRVNEIDNSSALL